MKSVIITRRKNVDWKNEFIPIINNILHELAEDGEKPSVRGMWYILVSRYPDKISNVPSMYSSYDKAITKARKGEYGEGKSLEEDAFVDNVRQIIDIDDDYETADSYIQRDINHIRQAHQKYTIPRWYKQSNYVEVCLEKDAVAKLEDTWEKKGDSNTEWFKLKHGDGRAYQIELDAMHARREQFEEFLLPTVDPYFDDNIYQRQVKKPQEKARKSIIALANKMINEQFPLEEDQDTEGGAPNN